MIEVRHPLAALVVAVTVVVLVAMAVLTPVAFGQGGSDHSCGASNPLITAFPPRASDKGDEFSPDGGACGFANNPNFDKGSFPPGQYNE
jgi:hypothetical protein